ncbi:hypothetical protein [Microbacterium sp. CH-015]|uniref:hypothetical protein n=1 Tax=Microbacterium sp. CH-015 TaxID=3406734 RepID=UPI003C7810C8
MNWTKPSTPIKLMLAWHGLAILIGIIISVSAGVDAGARWFAWGLLGIPVITIAALVWSAALKGQQTTAGNPVAPPAATPPVAPAPSSDARRHADVTWHRAQDEAVATGAPATRRRAREALDAKPHVPLAAASGTPFYLLGSDGYTWMEVEGEFARTDAIEKVVGRRLQVNQEVELIELDAELRPEPTNPYDRNAVMVIIKGWHVGYLGRDNAAEYHEPLARLTRAGVTPLVKARLWAAKRRNWEGTGDRLNARVTLAIGQPDRLAPINNPPAAPYSLIPWGGGLQVTGEEHHLDALSDFITPSGDGIAIGTLHTLTLPAAKGATKEVAEVRLDGERIGQMTPASSAHFLPTVRHLADQGRQTAVWVRVKGSAVAAQAVLQATKAHELPADWFGEPVTIPALYPRTVTAAAVDGETAEDVAEIVDGQRPAPMWDD